MSTQHSISGNGQHHTGGNGSGPPIGQRIRFDGRAAMMGGAAVAPRSYLFVHRELDAWHECPLRRALNVLVAVVGLILTAPLMLVIAVLVKLTSPGPVFYTQPRVGVDRRYGRGLSNSGRRNGDTGGRLFRIYKFRTMREDADQGGQTWATPDDPRITPIGGFLRKHRLDELPQLVNVLKGDMNVVGPRPEQPSIFQDLRREIPAYPRRQCVRPGLTGLAQVNHHYDRTVEDVETKLRYDLEYVSAASVGEDLRIMARTFPVVLGKGLTAGW